MSSAETSPGRRVYRRVLMTAVPLVALAMIVTTAVAGFQGLALYAKEIGPERGSEVLWKYGFIIVSTALTEGAVLLVGFLVLRRLIGRVARLVDEMQELTRGVLHDLRTPLSHVRQAADLLSRGMREPAEAAEEICAECDRVLAIVDRNAEITLACGEEGKPVSETVDAAAVVRDAAELFAPVAGEKGLTLSASVPEGTVPLRMRGTDLRRIVGNLVDNAVKFTERGTVTVSLASDSRAVTLEVADTGVGMNSEELEHAYERFYRAERSRSVPGTGLGLALVRALVVRYRGEISCRSVPGRGTTFAVRWQK